MSSIILTRLLVLSGATVGFALLLAVVLHAPDTRTALASGPCSASAPLDSEEQLLLTLINQHRAQHGLTQLQVSQTLSRAADWHAHDMGQKSYFSHTDSLGRSPSQRATDCGYPSGAGENIAAGTSWSTAQRAFDGWKGSAGHNQNMLNPDYRVIGIARANVPGSQYGWYWVTTFGLVVEQGNPPPPTNTPTAPPPTATPTPTKPPAAATPTPTKPPATATPTPTKPPATATPTATPPPQGSTSTTLMRGANLITWGGPNTAIGTATTQMNLPVAIVYAWNPQSRVWLRYAPQGPGSLNTLTVLRTGEAYWVITR